MKTALRLGPHATVVGGSRSDYSRYSRGVTEIIAAKAPLLEKASIDEFYVDLTGFDRFFQTAKFTAELKKKVAVESGLPVSYGLASNKLISKVATNEVKPDGQIEIPFGHDVRVFHPAHARTVEREALSERATFFEKDALLLTKHPARYRTLFLREGHYLNTKGFHEHFRRGALKYGVQIDVFLSTASAGSTA